MNLVTLPDLTFISNVYQRKVNTLSLICIVLFNSNSLTKKSIYKLAVLFITIIIVTIVCYYFVTKELLSLVRLGGTCELLGKKQ